MRRLFQGLLAGALALFLLGLLAGAGAGQSWPTDTTPCRPDDAKGVKVPEDFTVTYRQGPYGLPVGRETSLTVRASGAFVIERVTLQPALDLQRPGDKEVLVANWISADRLRRIYARLVACDFFRLQRRYDNHDIFDGRQELIAATAGGRSHSVGVHYVLVHRFSAIRSALFREVPVAGDYF